MASMDMDMHHRVFLSLRFAEAMEEGIAVKAALEQRGISTFLCDVAPGDNIADVVIEAIDRCELAVILGTSTYGEKTASNFSTREELEFIIDDEKPFFLVKMCERFKHAKTRFYLPTTVSYYPWMPTQACGRSTVPGALVDAIVGKLDDAGALHATGAHAVDSTRQPGHGMAAAQHRPHTTPSTESASARHGPTTRTRGAADTGAVQRHSAALAHGPGPARGGTATRHVPQDKRQGGQPPQPQPQPSQPLQPPANPRETTLTAATAAAAISTIISSSTSTTTTIIGDASHHEGGGSSGSARVPQVDPLAAAVYVLEHGEVEGSLHALEIVQLMSHFAASPDVQRAGCAALAKILEDRRNTAKPVEAAAAGAIEMVLQTMRHHSSSPAVQCHACKALQRLARDQDNRARIVRLGGVDIALSALKLHRTNVNVSTQAFGVFVNLSADANGRARVIALGGVDLALHALQQHVGDSHLQAHACGALMSMALDNSAKAHIISKNGIAAVMRAMETHPTDQLVQAYCCGCIMNFTRGNGVQRSDYMLGGLEMLLIGMQLHADDSTVQTYGLGALANLAAKSEEHQRKIDLLGGVSVIQDTMTRFRAVAKVQQYGTNALKHLPPRKLVTKPCATIASADVILGAMKRHESNTQLQAFGCLALRGLAAYSQQDKTRIVKLGGINVLLDRMGKSPCPTVQERACKALSALCASPDNAAACVSLGGVKRLLALLNSQDNSGSGSSGNSSNPQARVALNSALCLLATLCHRCEDTKDDVASLGGVERVLAVMKAFSADDQLQMRACAALAALADGHFGNKRQIASLGGVEVVMAALNAHSKQPLVVRNSCQALSGLVIRSSAARAKVLSLGGLTCVLAAMTASLLRDQGVQAAACRLLMNLATDPEARNAIAEQGGIEAVLTAMKMHSSFASVQEPACGALYNLSFEECNLSQLRKNNAAGLARDIMQRHKDTPAHDIAARLLRQVKHGTDSASAHQRRRR